MHPTTIITGFKLALNEAIKFIHSSLEINIKNIYKDKEILSKIVKTSLASKLINDESNVFTNIIVEAMLNIKTIVNGNPVYPLKSINILKCHGLSLQESFLVNGMAISHSRASQKMPKYIKKAYIACIDFNLNKFKLPLGVQLLIDDPRNIEKIRKRYFIIFEIRELDITKERCMKIIKTGANVILCSGTIDDYALKYFVESKTIVVRRIEKNELKRIAKATGASVITTLADESGEEKGTITLGYAAEVYEQRIGDNDYIFFTKCSTIQSQTIFLRGSNNFMLDEIERNIKDGMSVLKNVLESNSVVAGGGAVESSISLYLDDFARSLV